MKIPRAATKTHCSQIYNLKKKKKRGENKMEEELVDMEYISLQGYIGNTSLDTEAHAEHQMRADRSTWPAEKNV